VQPSTRADEGAEAVPLDLERPPAVLRQRTAAGEHRGRKLHRDDDRLSGAGAPLAERAALFGARSPDSRENCRIASYSVNKRAVAKARRLIESRQYVLDSDWGDAQPKAEDENAFLESHSWEEYAEWHLGLTDGATDETKARYAFVYGDLRRLHRTGLIACQYRAAEWRHKEVELVAHELLQLLDRASA
jgi:hypothetical protein